MAGSGGLLSKMEDTAMGDFGKIKSLSDLPPDHLILTYIKKAAKLNDEGVSLPKRPTKESHRPLKTPRYFMRALGKNKKALKTFQGFNYTNKREYLDWITEAKTEQTRIKRLADAVEWLSEGKSRNWKYSR